MPRGSTAAPTSPARPLADLGRGQSGRARAERVLTGTRIGQVTVIDPRVVTAHMPAQLPGESSTAPDPTPANVADRHTRAPNDAIRCRSSNDMHLQRSPASITRSGGRRRRSARHRDPVLRATPTCPQADPVPTRTGSASNTHSRPGNCLLRPRRDISMPLDSLLAPAWPQRLGAQPADRDLAKVLQCRRARWCGNERSLRSGRSLSLQWARQSRSPVTITGWSPVARPAHHTKVTAMNRSYRWSPKGRNQS